GSPPATSGATMASADPLGDARRLNPSLGAFVALADEIGPGPLLAVKDNIDVRGFATAAGIGALRHRRATADAPVVARWKAAGGAIVGKTNLHEGALGVTTDNPAFGRCLNPAVPGAVPGGSSGGSAAAVAAGLVRYALGTDTMGSVRIPASYCGIVGFKPGFDVLPTEGVVPLSWSLDHIGILAASVADAAFAFARLGGDAASPAPATPRLAVPRQLHAAALQPDVARAFEAALEALRRSGAELREIDLGFWSPARLRKAGLIVTEVEGAVVHATLLDDPASELSAEFRGLLDYGRHLSAPRYAEALRHLREVGRAADAALHEVDALVLPTAPQTAFAFDGPTPVDVSELTALANAGGLPALSLPIPRQPKPVGLQLVARRGADAALLGLAARLEAILAREES
ncbi:MAG: amidase, partial [Pseudomonadota bacterium]